MRFWGIFLLFLTCAALCQPDYIFAGDNGKLLKLVILSRHGVRSPTQSGDILKLWSQKQWPVWPVKPGELTERGARLVTAMWGNLKDEFIKNDLLPENSCPAPNAVFVRADVDERTKATASAILDGIGPDCQMGFASVKGKVDPLFHPLKARLYRFNPITAATDILSMTAGSLDNQVEDYWGAIMLVEKITGSPAPLLCERFNLLPNCQIEDLPNAISVSPDGTNVRLIGSLAVASSLAEIFLMEYAQWPDSSAGWGQVNSTVLGQILPVHTRMFDIVNRAPVVAWAKGSSLLKEMAAALTGKHYDPRCNDAKIVIYVGHDTNIANIAGLLSASWQVSGYPQNSIPPAGAVFLELWENDGKQTVKARFYTQTLHTLHLPFEDGDADIVQFAPVSTRINAANSTAEMNFEVDDFMQRVQLATAGAPQAPHETPALNFKPVLPPKGR